MRITEYYYGQLDKREQATYRAMLAGTEAMRPKIVLPTDEVDLLPIFNAVLLDNPLIFYARSYVHQGKDFWPDYLFSRPFVRQATREVLDYLRVFDGLRGESDLKKQLAVHDFCLNNFRYDDGIGMDAFSVLGPVRHGAAVCEGIAKFVKLALNHVGIKCIVARGMAHNPTIGGVPENHAWNIVKIDGKNFHMDATFNLTLTGAVKRYDYFNLADVDVANSHRPVGILPPCTTTGRDYLSLRGMVAHTPQQLDDYIATKVMQGKRHMVVKLKNVKDATNVADRVMDIALRHAPAVDISYNLEQMVFEIKLG